MSETKTLDIHESDPNNFIRRHVGLNEDDIAVALKELGVKSVDELISKTVPSKIRTKEPMALLQRVGERDALSSLRKIAARNQVFVSMIGQGYYGTVTPKVILRNLLESPAWYTAYTPYQAEISQGRMEALLNYQQMVTDLTGMEVANASLLDEATAAAEAMTMLMRINSKAGTKFFVDDKSHPQTIAVIKTRAKALGIEIIIADRESAAKQDDLFGAFFQYPDTHGHLSSPEKIIADLHAKNVLVAVATDLLALCLVKSPGEMGADIALGNSQRFGVPMGYGGPHAAFFATKEQYIRQMPGRVIGVSQDAMGRPALRMALQTREQHIRREKANSNICTAQVLLAVIAAMYAAWHGPKGLKYIAERVHRKAASLAKLLENSGLEIVNKDYFDTLLVKAPSQAPRLVARARAHQINIRLIDRDHFCIALDESARVKNIGQLLTAFQIDADYKVEKISAIPKALQRTSEYLTHPVFNSYHSETKMMRYLRNLSDKDIALDRAMIPLGSCTMKLNAAAEMLPITWREFAMLHPFAPSDQAKGYQEIILDLQDWLCAMTGFNAVSLQPNSGSQGEYTGLLCIMKYHESRKETNRNICLIPTSAHGTNPASAVMAGMKVVAVNCDDDGNVDLAHLQEMIDKHEKELAALMVTYPSTHGVFEEKIKEICAAIHKAGGQVYMDGANFNAMMGHARPAEIGADVLHFNLHKTFCIPHGGGGPGIGPIGVGAHLAPYLPDHGDVDDVNPLRDNTGTVGAVAAAPWGSAGILPISWMYIRMMGDEGLRHCASIAILSANYIAKRLSAHYDILYKGVNGTVAHECIIDIRGIKANCGVTVDDIAKRLVDFGFHSPTMSWPVAETLMIEPTESESLEELDRFIDAMITIRDEIRAVESGSVAVESSPLRNAPHVHALLFDENWPYEYTKKQAFFPGGDRTDMNKYWPPTSRVDNVFGDKNLMCSCLPMSAYAEAAE